MRDSLRTFLFGRPIRLADPPPRIIRSKNPSTLSIFAGLSIGAIAGVISCRLIYPHYNFGVGFILGFVVFGVMHATASATVNMRHYSFDAENRTISVETRWLVAFKGRRAEYSFEEIREVSFTVQEMAIAILVLRSGKRLFPETGSPARVRRFCAEVARMTGKMSATPVAWR